MGVSQGFMADLREQAAAGRRPGPMDDSQQNRPAAVAGSQPVADHSTAGAGAPVPAAKKSDLPARLLTAVALVPVLIFAIIKGGGIWTLLIAAIVVAASWEFFNFMEAKGLRGAKWIGLTGSVGLVLGASFSNEYFSTLILTVILLAAFIRQLGTRDISTAITGPAVTLFGVTYVGWLSSHLVWLRNIGVEVQAKYFVHDPSLPQAMPEFRDVGMYYLFMGVAATFLADTGGYFFGKAFGRHKLAPSISPKKTWEGFVGQIVGAVFGASVCKLVFMTWIYPDLSFGTDFGWVHCAILGILIANVGLVGDLFESMLKRDAQVKDASGLLPGHGGFLDRLDSINFAIPVTYYYVRLYYYWTFSPNPEADLRALGEYLSAYIFGK